MKKLLPLILVGFLGILLSVSCSGADDNAGANRLFVEAFQLVKSAQEAEKTSYVEAFKLYQNALAKVESIPEKYPSSDLAVKIVQGDVKLGSYSLTEFKEVFLPQAKMKAEIEENPLACALFVARTIGNAHDKAEALAEIAGKYAAVGQYDRALLEVAKTIEKADDKARALAWIAIRYTETGQEVDDKARKLLHEIIETVEARAR
jgi:tetratricopeptide (TPR) repeat protein